MKHKLGILTALILSLAITGSTFAASPGNSKQQQNKTAAKTKTSYTAKTKKAKKPRKRHQTKTAKMMKNNNKSTTTKPK